MAKKTTRSRSQATLTAPSLFGSDPEAFVAPSASDFVVSQPTKPQAMSPTPQASAQAATGSATSTIPDSAITPDTALRFISFGSGSSGNCAYIGTLTEGVLIDAGIDEKTVYGTLKDYGVTPDMIKGVFLTHDHGDHVRYAYKLVRRYPHIGVFCTPRVLQGIFRRHNISRTLRERHVPIFKEIPKEVAGMTITAFEVPHDGSDNAGFFIEYGDMKFAIATDIGSITSRARHYLSQANFLMLESNYDPQMLEEGAYPEYLKSRIRGENGHLENSEGARFVAEIYSPALRYLFLCHLSKDNNTPEIALETYRKILTEAGIEVGDGAPTLCEVSPRLQLIALPRYTPTSRYLLSMK